MLVTLQHYSERVKQHCNVAVSKHWNETCITTLFCYSIAMLLHHVTGVNGGLSLGVCSNNGVKLQQHRYNEK